MTTPNPNDPAEGTGALLSYPDATSLVVDLDPMQADAWRRGRLGVYLRSEADAGKHVVVMCNGNPIVTLKRGTAP